MILGLLVLLVWLVLGIVVSVPRIRGRHSAVGLALLAGGSAFVAFGLWSNWHSVPAPSAAQRDPLADTYYVVAHGHYAISSGILLLALSAVAIWLHRRAPTWTSRVARTALWLVFATAGGQVALSSGMWSIFSSHDFQAIPAVNRTASVLAVVTLLALGTIALCIVWTVWCTWRRRS